MAVSGQAGDTRLPGATVATVDAASTETVTIPLSAMLAGTADVTATYTIDGRTGTVDRTVALTGSAATGADSDAEPDRSAAGLGGLPVSAVGAALVALGGAAVVGYRRRKR